MGRRRDVWAEFTAARRGRRSTAAPVAEPAHESPSDGDEALEQGDRTQQFLTGQLGFDAGSRVAVFTPGRGTSYAPAERLEEVLRSVTGARLATAAEEESAEQQEADAHSDPGALATALATVAQQHGAGLIPGSEARVRFWERQQQRHPVGTIVGEGIGILADAALIAATGGAAAPELAEARGAGTLAGVAARAATPGGLATAAREVVGAGAEWVAGQVEGQAARRLVSGAGRIAAAGAEAGVYGAQQEAVRELSRREELAGESIAAAFQTNAMLGLGFGAAEVGFGAAARMLARRSRFGGVLMDPAGVRDGADRLQRAFVSGGPDGMLAASMQLEAEAGARVADAAWDAATQTFELRVPRDADGVRRISHQLAEFGEGDAVFRASPEGRVAGMVRRIGSAMADPYEAQLLGYLSKRGFLELRGYRAELDSGVENIMRSWRSMEQEIRTNAEKADDIAIRMGLLDDIGAEATDGIPTMITRDMKQRLRTAGFSEDQIRNMTPIEAHQHLGSSGQSRIHMVRTAALNTIHEESAAIRDALTGTRPTGAIDEFGNAVMERVALSVRNPQVQGLLREGLTTLFEAAEMIVAPGADGARVFRTMNEAKRKLFRGVDALRRVEGVPGTELDAARDLYGGLVRHLQDPLVWGQRVADLQTNVNRAYARMSEHEKVLDRIFGAESTGEVGRAERRPVAERIKSWLTSRIEHPHRAAEAERELNGYVQQIRDLDRAIKGAGAESELEGHVARVLGQVQGVRKAADAMGIVDHVLRRERQSSSLGVVAAGGGMVGSMVTGGLAGSLVGSPVAGAVAGGAARLAWAAVSRPAQAMLFLAGMAQAARKVTRSMEGGMSAIRKAVGTGERGLFPRPPAAMATFLNPSRREKGYDSIVKEVKALAQNPQELLRRVGASTRNIDDRGEPGMAREAALTAMRAVHHLAAHLPPDQGPVGFGRPARASNAEMASFMRRWHAINDPLALLRMIAAGRVAHEHVEAVQDVFPRLHEEMTRRVVQELTRPRGRGQRSAPYWLRMAAGEATGIQGDPSADPMFIAAMQERSAQTEAQAEAMGMGSMPARSGSRPKSPESYPSGSQGLEEAL